MDDKKRFALQKQLKELSEKRARHTELVSVYIPAGFNIQKVIDQIDSEASTARNIKASATRKNVTAALEKMSRELRNLKKTPLHGLAAFSGNVSTREGVQDIQFWSIEPDNDISVRVYKCGQGFYLEPLEQEAHADMYMAEIYFEKDSFNLALNGDGQYLGFLDIVDEYSLASAGNLANYYAGLCY